MRSSQEINPGYSRLRWVILLLGVAVILPTICLVWFMTRAIKNERLAVRQKLVNICEDFALRYSHMSDEFWSVRKSIVLKELIERPAVDMFYAMTFSGSQADGAIIFEKDKVIYPIEENAVSDETTEELEKALQLEFSRQDYLSALEFYKDIIAGSNSELTHRKAQMGVVRCSMRLGNINDAISCCRDVVFTDIGGGGGGKSFGQVAQIRANAALLLAQLFEKNKDTQPARFAEYLRNVFAMVNHYASQNPGYRELPSSQRIFLYEQAMVIYERNKELPQEVFAHHIELAGRMAQAEKLSLTILEKHYNLLRQSGADGKPYRVRHTPGFYFAKYSAGDSRCVLLFSRETLLAHFKRWQEESPLLLPFDWRIIDNAGQYIAGITVPPTRPLFTSSMGSYLSDWKLEFYIRDKAGFDQTAKSQITMYLWAGVLVIVLMLASGGFAVQVIGRQIKLNKLKNDFIATVSHELKTPLSSMRVLVDTLLEGNYNEQKQATEYLRLVSKENERLSRLIDNFLTFSRMERNKQAFDMVEVSPDAIAKNAAEAVQTKFNHESCKFSVTIDDNLPSIMADKDAMVTVLVNLLDNAYKYSYDNKQIELKVFSEDSFVCFSVKDNGIGMTRRQMKRVFDRFYQADSSLSRREEGTGLGLSIVKFIVDAHKGQITVESKPNKGTTFTVKLTAII